MKEFAVKQLDCQRITTFDLPIFNFKDLYPRAIATANSFNKYLVQKSIKPKKEK